MILTVLYGCASLTYDEYGRIPDDPTPAPESTPDPAPDTLTERWECFDYVYSSRKLGTLTVDQYGTSGTVDFNGIVASTQYAVQGIERRWDWGWGTDGRSDYAFVISADGTGKYYNFLMSNDGTAKPSELFKCKKR